MRVQSTVTFVIPPTGAVSLRGCSLATKECPVDRSAPASINVLAFTADAGLYRVLGPALDFVGKGDPRILAFLVDRDRRGWKV